MRGLNAVSKNTELLSVCVFTFWVFVATVAATVEGLIHLFFCACVCVLVCVCACDSMRIHY